MHYKQKFEQEYRKIWIFSILSTLFGLALAIWMHQSESLAPILLLGVAHGVVCVPAMLIVRAGLWKTIGLSILCISFPVWGYSLVSLFTFGIGSPITNSLIWGSVLAIVFKQPRVFGMFFVIGLLTTGAIFYFVFVSNANSMSNMEGGFAETIGFWYLLVLPVFPMMIRSAHDAQIAASHDSCISCDYPYEGLAVDALCPECGSPRPSQHAGVPTDG